MGNNRLYNLLSRVVKIKLGEEKLAILLFSCFFLITAPHTIIKTLRYADLLQNEGSKRLPIAYLSAAVVAGLVVFIHSKIQFRFSNQRLMISSLVFFVISGLLFSVILHMDFAVESAFLRYTYWVWGVVLVAVLVTQFWLIINEVFNPREAKRLIGFCGSGGILGGMFGGLLAKLLTDIGGAKLLFPLACALLFLCALVVKTIYRIYQKTPSFATRSHAAQKRAEPQQYGLIDSFNTVRKNKHLILIASIIIVSVIVTTFIDFHFCSIVENNSINQDEIQAFLGLFLFGLNTFVFFLNLFFTSFSLKNIGIRVTLLFTPIALLIGSAVVLIAPPILLPAVAIKGTDEGLGFSLQQSVREFLYIPVSSELKRKSKLFIDIFLKRFAIVIASILLLVFALSLDKKVVDYTPIFDVGLSKDLLWLVIGFLILWIVLSLSVPKEYINIIRNNIKILRPSADKIVAEKLDVDYARLVFDTIESKDQSSILYALQLFDLLEQDKLTPEIKALITQKADEEKGASLGDLFSAEGAMWFPEIEDDIAQESFITDIREIMSLENYQRLIESYADRVIEEGSKSEIEKMELAKMIGMMDQKSQVVKKLKALIKDESAGVARYAIQSAARLKREEDITFIIDKLSNPLIHEDAVSAVKSYGHRALHILQKYLGDSGKTMDMRKNVVKVLARIGTQDAVQILFDQLEKKTEELDTDLVDALDRIRSEKADIHFPLKFVRRKACSVIKKYCQDYLELMRLSSDEQNEDRGQKLQKQLTEGFAQVFKLLGLYYPHEDIVKAYQNLQTGTKDSVANAIELLDNILSKEMKDIVLPLIEDLSATERQKEFRRILKNLK